MTLISTSTETDIQEKKYPSLMISNDLSTIVLFSERNKGMVVNISKDDTFTFIGYISSRWDESEFKRVPSGFSVTITQS